MNLRLALVGALVAGAAMGCDGTRHNDAARPRRVGEAGLALERSSASERDALTARLTELREGVGELQRKSKAARELDDLIQRAYQIDQQNGLQVLDTPVDLAGDARMIDEFLRTETTVRG